MEITCVVTEELTGKIDNEPRKDLIFIEQICHLKLSLKYC